MVTLNKITVFGGASKNLTKRYNDEAFRFGEMIGKNGQTLVFGIGDNGMMGEVFRGALKQNAPIRGITTKKLLELQCENPSLFKENEIEIVPDLFERKRRMFIEGDIIVIFPGGWGTLDEIADFSVSIQIGVLPKKPVIFVNFDGFWHHFRAQLERMYDDGSLESNKIDYIAFVDNVDDIFPAAEELLKYLNS